MPKNLWNDHEAPAGDGLASLAYRSRLLGADRSLVNIYGGNTSTKEVLPDHLRRDTRVLWVKGSGSDIADITERGFAGLKMEEIDPLFDRDSMSDEEMVAYLERTVFEPGRPRQSIETLLHAFVPAKHVDHTHPDAIISLACSPNGQALMREIYGDRAAWVDYIRPGFTLSQQIGEAVRSNPKVECVVMGKHGMVTWGETSRECYENTLRLIGETEKILLSRAKSPAFGEARCQPLPAADRDQLLQQVLPVLRGRICRAGSQVLLVDTSDPVLEFVCSAEASELSQVGAACPDHLVHTKRVPLYVDWVPDEGIDALQEKLRQALDQYEADYRAYFEENQSDGDVMFPPTPRVTLIPGMGMINAGADATAADVSRQLYLRAIEVMRGARSLGGFLSLSSAESYRIEYWPLELYKLSLKPKPKALAGKVAVVTGAASGIGRAIAHRLADEGAHVAVFDINDQGSAETVDQLVKAYGQGRAIAVNCNVTQEAAVQQAFAKVIQAYGGVDIVVSNAGIASSAPLEDTSIEDWNRNMAILATGYFLVSREAFRIWKAQGVGGNLVYIASKNSLAAGKNAAAYSAAKAAELHLARCLAEEGGAHGIRVNSVLPDAVLSGSGIWDGNWRQERADTYGIKPDELDEFYRNRTTLKVSVYPQDIAEAVAFFAGPASAKTTGGILTVDGGVPAAYAR